MTERASWAGSDAAPQIIAVCDELCASRSLEHAVADLYPRNSLVVQFGGYESFKSTDVAHLAVATAYTGDYHGHKVKRGLAFILAAEDPYGLDQRLSARLAVSGLDPRKVDRRRLLRSGVGYSLIKSENVRKLRDKLLRIVETVERDLVFIGIDTLMKNFGEGSENDTADISHVLENIDRYLKEPFKALVVATTHTGHGNERRPRGSSAILPAVDMGIRMKPTSVGVTIECVRNKNGPRFAPLHLAKEIVTLPSEDRSRKSGTSIILKLLKEAPDESLPSVITKPTKSKADRLLELFEKLRREKFESKKREGRTEAQVGIQLSQLKRAAIDTKIVVVRQDFFKQKEKLVKNRSIRIEEKLVNGKRKKLVFARS